MNANEDLYHKICDQVHSIDYHNSSLLGSAINSVKKKCISACRRSHEASIAKKQLEDHGFAVPGWIVDAIHNPDQWSE